MCVPGPRANLSPPHTLLLPSRAPHSRRQRFRAASQTRQRLRWVVPASVRSWRGTAGDATLSPQVIGGSDTYLPTCRTCFNADRSTSLSALPEEAEGVDDESLGTPSLIRRAASRTIGAGDDPCAPMSKLRGTRELAATE